MSIGVDLIKLCKALNCENKLKIIDLIFRKGKRSITDVRNDLDLSFSTVHKYLNQLEEAEILFSTEISENNRQKKIYKLNQFFMEISPEEISKIVKRDITNHEESLKYGFTDILGRRI